MKKKIYRKIKSFQILEYNGADLRRVTAEHAANEISKPAEKVTIVVQFNLKSKFSKISISIARVLISLSSAQNSIKSKMKLEIRCTYVSDSIAQGTWVKGN